MANLFCEIIGEVAAIKGIPMQAPPLAPMSDDMQGECFRSALLCSGLLVGWQGGLRPGGSVYINSGSPASNKQRPFELRGRVGDSLHKPVDTDVCTSSLLVPRIIPSTSLLQSVEGGKTGLRSVVTASGQHSDPSAAARQLVACSSGTSAVARRLAACSADTSAASRQLTVYTATDSVTSL